jgi:hypothetical protein
MMFVFETSIHLYNTMKATEKEKIVIGVYYS